MPRNQLLVPGARSGLEQLKYEVANEVGLPNYAAIDKGELPSRLNGTVGGNMVRRMVAAYEQSIAQNPGK
ncbi:MAG: small, acid-soluble spore protein, alpha/beta type [Bacillota bacterium]